ncbi:MAG: hypothetical protein IJ736_00015 [Firmicutes bacterium]|nr:hypothetical protein [Bacillota bacterium]
MFRHKHPLLLKNAKKETGNKALIIVFAVFLIIFIIILVILSVYIYNRFFGIDDSSSAKNIEEFAQSQLTHESDFDYLYDYDLADDISKNIRRNHHRWRKHCK